MTNYTGIWTHYSSYHVYPHLAIYFGPPSRRYPTFLTLTSVGQKELFSMSKTWCRFRAVVKYIKYISDLNFIQLIAVNCKLLTVNH